MLYPNEMSFRITKTVSRLPSYTSLRKKYANNGFSKHRKECTFMWLQNVIQIKRRGGFLWGDQREDRSRGQP